MSNWLIEYQQQFSNLLKQRKLPHAILLQGLMGSGKQFFATWLTQLLHCKSPNYQHDKNIYIACQQCKHCLLYQKKNYPDHQEIIEDKKTISVDEIRKINQFLEKKAQLGMNKTVVIYSAETMTTAAANALLKTLEEPSENSTILLLTTEISSLLPTVISRCRVLTIRPLVGEKLLIKQTPQAEPYINISQLAELNNNDIKQEYFSFIHLLLNYLQNQQGLNELASMLVENNNAYRWFEKLIVNLLRYRSGWQINQELLTVAEQEWLTQITPAKLWKSYQLLLNTSKQIKQLNQVNKQFISEKLLINCASIMQGD